MEMIERVAAALEAAFEREGRVFDAGQAADLARAAIEAMKLPTPEMEEAGFQAGHEGDGEWEYASPLATYTAMIDAALKP